MNKNIALIGLFIFSFLFFIQIGLLLLAVKPDLFSVFSGYPAASPPDQPKTIALATPAAESTAVKTPPVARSAKDTAAAAPAKDLSQLKPDTAKPAPQKTSEAQPESLLAAADTLKSAPPADSTAVDEIKVKAKLLEAMNPENAAKILTNLNDTEVKGLLMKMKNRQAGKILSALEPDRAARIMR